MARSTAVSCTAKDAATCCQDASDAPRQIWIDLACTSTPYTRVLGHALLLLLQPSLPPCTGVDVPGRVTWLCEAEYRRKPMAFTNAVDAALQAWQGGSVSYVIVCSKQGIAHVTAATDHTRWFVRVRPPTATDTAARVTRPHPRRRTTHTADLVRSGTTDYTVTLSWLTLHERVALGYTGPIDRAIDAVAREVGLLWWLVTAMTRAVPSSDLTSFHPRATSEKAPVRAAAVAALFYEDVCHARYDRPVHFACIALLPSSAMVRAKLVALVPEPWLRDMNVREEFHVTTQFVGYVAHTAEMEGRLVRLALMDGRAITLTLLCVMANRKAVAIVVRNGGHTAPGATQVDGDAEVVESGTLPHEPMVDAADECEFVCANAVAHITVATRPKVPPSYSNVLCAPDYDADVEGPRTVQALPPHTTITGAFMFC